MTQEADLLANTFIGGNSSTDGKWIIVDKGGTEMCSWVDFDIDSIPQYMKDLGVDECCLTHDLALAVTGIAASVNGASDGWTYFEVVE